MAVDITEKVSGRVTNLVVTRSDTDLKAEWKIPPYMTDEERSDRATFLDAVVEFKNPESNGQPLKRVEVWDDREGSGMGPGDTPLGEFKDSDVFWIKGLGLHNDVTVPYDRKRFYPLTDRKCDGVIFSVHGGNGTGGGDIHDLATLARGPETKVTYTFQKPKTANVADWSVDSTDRDKLNTTINDNDGKDEYERYDLMYRILRMDNKSTAYKSFSPIVDWTSVTELEKQLSVTVSDGLSLFESQFIEIKAEVYSRGIAGNSDTVSKNYVYAWPARPTITEVVASSLDSSGIVTVKVKTNHSNHRPIQSLQLQRAKPSTYYEKASDVPGSEFSDVSGSTGTKNSTGLMDSVGEAKPNRGKQTFYRVKAVNGTYTTYSEPVEAKVLFTEGRTSAHDMVGITSVTTNEYADVVYVKIGWNDDNSNDTEITYSDHEDAWESTSKPTSTIVDWEDATPEGEIYQHTASLSIYDAQEGVPMYIKGRRHGVDDDGNESYGPYVTPGEANYPYTPVTKPTDVQLDVPSYLERGKDLSVSWTYQGTSEQKNWILYRVPDPEAPDDNRVVLASGDDDDGFAKVPYSSFDMVGEHMHVFVSLTTGSEWANSPVKSITVMDKPNVRAVVTTPMVVQPLTIYASSDTGNDRLIVKVFSLGITVDKPDKDVDQLYGDVIWSGISDPAWGINPEDGLYYTAISLPSGLEFYDLGWYRISVVGVNKTSNLSSDEQVMDFNVKWLHQAMQPSPRTSMDIFEDDRSVRITPVAPSNYEEGDVYDLYRVTPSNVYLIASDLQYGTSVLDRYAPFSKTADLRYRICNRTSDGDFAWRDMKYRIRGAGRMRLDWGRNEYVELPYDVTQSDSLAKDVGITSYLNGNRAGYWNEAITHKSSLGTKLIKFEEPEQLESVYYVGHYAGPVFVRLPDGQAFEANVDVGGIDRNFDELVMTVSLDAEEISLTSEFMVRSEDIVYPPLGEEEEHVLAKSRILQWSSHVPVITDEFAISDVPYGPYLVSLSSSFNYYMETYPITTAYYEDGKVYLGHSDDAFDEDIADYIAAAVADSDNAQFLIKFDYNVEIE